MPNLGIEVAKKLAGNVEVQKLGEKLFEDCYGLDKSLSVRVFDPIQAALSALKNFGIEDVGIKSLGNSGEGVRRELFDSSADSSTLIKRGLLSGGFYMTPVKSDASIVFMSPEIIPSDTKYNWMWARPINHIFGEATRIIRDNNSFTFVNAVTDVTDVNEVTSKGIFTENGANRVRLSKNSSGETVLESLHMDERGILRPIFGDENPIVKMTANGETRTLEFSHHYPGRLDASDQSIEGIKKMRITEAGIEIWTFANHAADGAAHHVYESSGLPKQIEDDPFHIDPKNSGNDFLRIAPIFN